MSPLYLLLLLVFATFLNIYNVHANIADCEAKLWRDKDKQGTEWGPFVRGEYKPPEIESDEVSSVSIFGGECCRLKLFNGNTFNKKSITKKANKWYNLGNDFNDKMGSFQVYCEGKCEIFLYAAKEECEGECRKGPFAMGQHKLEDIKKKGMKDNKVSSVRVRGDPNCRARMYEKDDFKGKRINRGHGYHNTLGKLNNKMSSMKVFVCNVFLYEKENFEGDVWGPFGPGNWDRSRLKQLKYDKTKIGSVKVKGSGCCVGTMFKESGFKKESNMKLDHGDHGTLDQTKLQSLKVRCKNLVAADEPGTEVGSGGGDTKSAGKSASVAKKADDKDDKDGKDGDGDKKDDDDGDKDDKDGEGGNPDGDDGDSSYVWLSPDIMFSVSMMMVNMVFIGMCCLIGLCSGFIYAKKWRVYGSKNSIVIGDNVINANTEEEEPILA